MGLVLRYVRDIRKFCCNLNTKVHIYSEIVNKVCADMLKDTVKNIIYYM